MNARYALSFFLIGSVSVVLGGLVAAVSTPLALERGPWISAYLVLVCGVAQCLFGIVRRRLAPSPMTPSGFVVEVVCWNVGGAAVIVGALVGTPALVAVGGVLLAVVLIRQLLQLRYRIPGLSWAAWLYGIIVAVLLVSIPVGIVLSMVTP